MCESKVVEEEKRKGMLVSAELMPTSEFEIFFKRRSRASRNVEDGWIECGQALNDDEVK